jgi:hypothetical protein
MTLSHPNATKQVIATFLGNLLGLNPRLVIFDSSDVTLVDIPLPTPSVNGLGNLSFSTNGTVVSPSASGTASYGAFQTNGGTEIFRADCAVGTFGDPTINLSSLTIDTAVPIRLTNNLLWRISDIP